MTPEEKNLLKKKITEYIKENCYCNDGSMTTDMLEKIMNEIFAIVGTRMCEITVIEGDMRIHKIYKVKSSAKPKHTSAPSILCMTLMIPKLWS